MYDLIVIGAGPAGYVAAERAGEMGKRVLLIEKDRLGGVCLNCGCIPTKAMLFSAKQYHHAKHAEAFGVKVKEVTFDYPFVKTRTERVQQTLRDGIAGLMKKNKVEVVMGEAILRSPREAEVGGKVYEGANLLIATGSRAFIPPIPGLRDNPKAVTNEGILAQTTMVDHLCIIGAGVIGVEFASLYATVGKKVTVIEMLPQICGNTDKELSKMLQKSLEARGVVFHLSATVTGVEGTTVLFKDKEGQAQRIEADLILVATGRAVNTEGLGLEKIGLDFDRRGIRVDDQARTNIPGVWAAGDVTARWQLAHFASRQATVAVRTMFGHPERCREDAVPAVVYTDPEIASVGLTEDQAMERGIPVKVAKFPFSANGRYLAETEGERGVVKVVVGAKRQEILGVHMIGPHVSEMIGAAAVMIETELRAQDVAEIIFPHPTISEVMHDVMFAFEP